MTAARDPLRFAFVRGTSPNKWAQRWRDRHPDAPLELMPLELAYVADPHSLDAHDLLLERVHPGSRPALTTGAAERHAVRLYREAVALVLEADHELADSPFADRETISLLTLLDHPGHAAEWPSAEAWTDETWRPRNTKQLLNLVATGAGAALMPLPLARQLARRSEHAVIAVTDSDALPETEIWASWAVERDAPDVQELVGVLRGRTARSSRGPAEMDSATAKAQKQKGAATAVRSERQQQRSGARKVSVRKKSRRA